ncbi:MAG: AtpZ/AtpI family protein [Chloroflexia bacterium]|nr:AtpZ/AtpI family protein [Chloroflexia bacterium]
MADDDMPDRQLENVKMVGLATGLGISVVVSLIVFIGLGILIDQWLDRSPVFTLIGVGVGLIGAGYQLYELVLVSDRKRRNGPIGRTMAQRIESRKRNKMRNDS